MWVSRVNECGKGELKIVVGIWRVRNGGFVGLRNSIWGRVFLTSQMAS